jgi:lysine 2,3-aminomutase
VTWQQELRGAITSEAELATKLDLTAEERRGIEQATRAGFGLRVSPYYLGLCDPHDPSCPLRRQVIPRAREGQGAPGDLHDPLAERAHEVAPRLIQRYPDRALLLVTDQCVVHCRFCTRAHALGRGRGAAPLADLGEALAYLASHPEIRDVILSGGDPLTLSTKRLCALLEAVRATGHVETIRLGTRAPVCLPSRITAELVRALRRFHPLWVLTHFNHPRELTPQAARACIRLVDAGFPVMNQTVLLRGVNDEAAVLADLWRGLVRVRVRPYYLMQMDPVAGSAHLRTSLGAGIAILEELQGKLSGIALPKLVLDTPGGLGKVPLAPNYIVRRRAGCTRLRTPLGAEVDYFDPPEEEGQNGTSTGKRR